MIAFVFSMQDITYREQLNIMCTTGGVRDVVCRGR